MATVLSDGSDALLVPPGDPGAVVHAIDRLARDRGLRARLGAAGRRTAERNGSWDVRASTLIEALRARGLLARTRGAPG
jgi:glycosyltransferase involved in cell wall biosynthesis